MNTLAFLYWIWFPSSSRGFRSRLSIAWLVSFLLILPAARAQGKGVVEGRLVNATNPSIVAANVELDVVGLGGGMSILKSAVTDAAGKFRIDGLPTDSPIMIRANYKSVNYHGRVNFDTSGKANVEIEVFEPTTSWKDIRVEGIRMAFQLAGDRLRSLETYSFVNQTKPPRTFMSMEGNFRFSKAPGILELPKVMVTGPGSAMPLAQSPLESPDAQSYYSLYGLRPGTTTFEVEQELPYSNKSYAYRKKFYQDASSFEIGVTPADMSLSGEGLKQSRTDAQHNFAVYSGGPVKAGMEVVLTFSGGTPVAEAAAPEAGAESRVRPMPSLVGQNALIIGPLLLMGFVAVLWHAFNYVVDSSPKGRDPRIKELKERRERLLNFMAALDDRYEKQSLTRGDYLRQREMGKRQLRRIATLLKK